MDVELIVLLVNWLLLSELRVVNAHHLLAYRRRSSQVIIITASPEVLSPSLWDNCVLSSLKAVGRASIHVFVANMDSSV